MGTSRSPSHLWSPILLLTQTFCPISPVRQTRTSLLAKVSIAPIKNMCKCPLGTVYFHARKKTCSVVARLLTYTESNEGQNLHLETIKMSSYAACEPTNPQRRVIVQTPGLPFKEKCWLEQKQHPNVFNVYPTHSKWDIFLQRISGEIRIDIKQSIFLIACVMAARRNE